MDFLDVSHIPIIIAITVVLFTAVYYFIKNRNMFPGPKGSFYFGQYFSLTDENVHLKLDEYKKEYGDLFCFTYCGRLFINMGSVKAIRELHVNNSECFSNRFSGFNILTYMLENSVTMVNGEPWKVLRKFFIQRFRDYGLNTVRDEMAGPVYDSLSEIIQDLKASQGKPVNILDVLTKRCAVTMRKVIFGEMGISDDDLQTLSSNYGEALQDMMGVNMLLFGPVASLLFAVHPRYNKSIRLHKDLQKILFCCAKKIENSLDDENSSCIIADYYKERDVRRKNNDPTWEIFTDKALVDSVLQFVGDGIVGVAGFIAGFLNALILHPEEQEKLYAELNDVVGPNRQPTVEDKSNLPYISAFMNEVLRAYTFLNMFPSLECTKETIIRGYRIPKGSITLLNFWSAHHDADTFEDPDTFKPSRYMSDPGKPKPELPVIFGMGKRSCSGEAFVMTQSFLFLTTIIKNFKIVSSNDPEKKSIDFFITGKLELIFQSRTEN